jgi:hypothetical protein
MVLPRAPLNRKVSRICGVQRLSLALRPAAWFIHTLARAGTGRGAVVFSNYSIIILNVTTKLPRGSGFFKEHKGRGKDR